MAKGKNSAKRREETGVEEFGMDDVDAFADARDQVLLEKAGMKKSGNDYDDLDDSDDEEAVEGVMDVDSDAEIEKYRKKFQGPIDESDEEYFKGEGGSDEDDGSDVEAERRWGGDYYGADEAEDEEDERLQEEEAMRLQKQHMEELNMGDFMLDEVEDWKSEKDLKKKEEADKGTEEDNDEKFEEMLKKGDKESRMEMISKKYPEYLPLVLELKELKGVYEDLKENDGEVQGVQFKALSLYLGSIVSYFAVFATKLQNEEKFDMKDEDVMVSILSTRELWRQAKGLKENVEDDAVQEVESDEASREREEEEVSEEEKQESDNVSEEEGEEEQEDVENEQSESDEEETPDFSQLRKIKKAQRKKLEDIDVLDAEDKKGRRKTLGFYTSKIDKRDLGKVNADGDMDTAYEETNDKPRYASRKPAQRDGRRRRN